jgi:glycosyltransferase involved in cell wall biosynthesis
MKELISVIVPCYNESVALPLFIEEMYKIIGQMVGQTFEIILINDGSRDNTKLIIKKLAEADERIKYISFSRNFGKEAAIYAGFQHANGDYVVMMDADLQDPPSLLPEMYKAVAEEGYDSVATRRVNRKGEPRIRSFFARCFYKIINKMSDVEIIDGARDYRLMNRKFLNALLELSEYNRFSKGLFGWVGFKNKWIDFENIERVAGETKWSFWSLFRYSIEGIVAFTTTPLIISSIVGFVFCLISVLAIAFIIIRRLVFGDPVAGWASLTCIITFLGGIQLFCLGILGQYMAKMYLEIKNRPIYLIDESNISKI